jgi:hypothetical protein
MTIIEQILLWKPFREKVKYWAENLNVLFLNNI